MVRKKRIQIIFLIILCGSLVFLTACQSKEDQRQSKIDQETTRVAKEIDEKLKVKGYTKENVSEALLDIYYPQNQFPRVNISEETSVLKKERYRSFLNSDAPQYFCIGVPDEKKDVENKCREIEEFVYIKDIMTEIPRLKIVIIDFSTYSNYEEWKKLNTPVFQNKKYSYLETNNKSKFILASENSGHIKTQTKTDTEPQKIENLIPETAEADRYEFMYTVFTKLNIPEN